MKSHPITLVKSDDGFAVWCDDLPGCCSQGKTRDEAMRNIRHAIAEYQAAQADVETRSGVRLEHAAVTV
jgi:predicted RNase H-like HicB family nuclease